MGENRATFKAPQGHKTSAALEIGRCGRVRVERTTLMSGGRRWRQAACLRVDVPLDGSTGAGDVTVRDCDIVAGDMATGILILNAQSARVRDNRIRVRADRSRVETIQRWSEDTMVSGWFGDLFFSHAIDGARVQLDSETHSSQSYALFDFSVEGLGSVSGYTAKTVGSKVWADFAKAYAGRARRFDTNKHMRLDIRRICGSLIVNGGGIKISDFEFFDLKPASLQMENGIAPIIDTGIVVAGERAGDISISGNSIIGALQGIRVGVDNGVRDERLRIDSIRVHDNFIRLPLIPLHKVRHGVYIGNARRAWVVDNDIARSGGERPTDRESSMLSINLGHIH
ncbi:MAG: hypothetical protein AAFQ99_13300, partial [Pseudomonadota bacterium]